MADASSETGRGPLEGRTEGTRESARHGRLSALAILGLLALSLLVFLGSQRHPPDMHLSFESIRLYTATAIVEHGSPCLNPLFDLYFPGWQRAQILPNVDASVRDGCYLLDKAPLQTWLAIPLVWLLSLFGRTYDYSLMSTLAVWWLSVVPATLGLWWTSRILATVPGVRLATARFLCAALLLATPMLGYTGYLTSHGVAAALMLPAIYLALGPPTRSMQQAGGWGRYDPFFGGLLLGALVLLEYPAAVVVLVTLVLGLLDAEGRRRLPAVVLGGLAPLLALLGWNSMVYGGPLQFSYAFKADPQHLGIVQTGVYGIGWPRLSIAVELLVGSRRGLFFAAPWLALAVVACRSWWSRTDHRAAWRLAPLALPLLMLLVLSGFEDWGAGTGMGPRHLLVVVPLLLLPLAAWLDGPVDVGRGHAVAFGFLLAGVAAGMLLAFVAFVYFPFVPLEPRNPFFEVVLPAFLVTGPGASALGTGPLGWVVFISQGIAICLFLGALAASMLRARTTPRAPIVVAGLILTMVLTSVLLSIHDPSPEARIEALHGRIAVLQFHGADDRIAPLVDELRQWRMIEAETRHQEQR